MNPRPLGVRVLVKLLEEEAPALWVPPSSTTKTLRAAVVEVGDDVQYVRVADEVLFSPERAWEIVYRDEKLFVMPEASILLILDRVDSPVR